MHAKTFLKSLACLSDLLIYYGVFFVNCDGRWGGAGGAKTTQTSGTVSLGHNKPAALRPGVFAPLAPNFKETL